MSIPPIGYGTLYRFSRNRLIARHRSLKKHGAYDKPASSRPKTKITHRTVAGTEIKFNSETKIYVRNLSLYSDRGSRAEHLVMNARGRDPSRAPYRGQPVRTPSVESSKIIKAPKGTFHMPPSSTNSKMIRRTYF